jgi:hypothetical protein
MRCEPTLRLGRTRPVDVRSSGSGTLSPIRFSAAYTIDTLEYSFRKRQAMKMFERVQAANESAWKDMQTANQKAFAELQKGWAEALSRFG